VQQSRAVVARRVAMVHKAAARGGEEGSRAQKISKCIGWGVGARGGEGNRAPGTNFYNSSGPTIHLSVNRRIYYHVYYR
jgi:hypothetical protein